MKDYRGILSTILTLDIADSELAKSLSLINMLLQTFHCLQLSSDEIKDHITPDILYIGVHTLFTTWSRMKRATDVGMA